MFLHLSVILSTGGGSAPLHAKIHPRDQRQVPPSPPKEQAHTPRDQRQVPSPQSRPPPEQIPPPPAQCMLGDTGNKRAVRIILECNLVCINLRAYLAFQLTSAHSFIDVVGVTLMAQFFWVLMMREK